MPEHLSPAASRVQRVRHELRMRTLEVRRTAQVSPQVRAVTLGGDALQGFHSPGFDDHIKLFLPAEGADAARRDYTPRRYDPMANELTLEFALHGDGPAAAWAARAQAGDRLDIGGPRGSFLPPAAMPSPSSHWTPPTAARWPRRHACNCTGWTTTRR